MEYLDSIKENLNNDQYLQLSFYFKKIYDYHKIVMKMQNWVSMDDSDQIFNRENLLITIDMGYYENTEVSDTLVIEDFGTLRVSLTTSDIHLEISYDELMDHSFDYLLMRLNHYIPTIKKFIQKILFKKMFQ
jgi:hypothetical protein